MTRRQIREHIFKILFSLEFFTEDEVEEQIENYFENEITATDEEKTEIADKVKAILSKKAEEDKILSEVSEGWSLKRMGSSEREILRIATYEVNYDDNVPAKVAINEAVELAKKYGSDDAPSFVNGVLAKIVKED